MNFPTLVLLAGGSSSRFAPLKEKILFKFLGRTLIERQLETFKNAGFERVIVIASENNYEQVKQEIEKVDNTVVVKVQVGNGQAGAVNTALSEIDDGEGILIANMNDIFADSIFEKFKAELLSNPDQQILVGYYSEKYFPGGYFTLQDDKVIGIVEKPGEGNEPSKIVNLVFDYFPQAGKLKKYLNEADSEKDDVYETALDNMMKAGEIFHYVEHKGMWLTIKYPWHVLAMMQYYLGNIGGQEISPNTTIAESAKIIGNVVIEDGVKIFDNAVIKGPVYIGRNSIVANNALVRDSHIGNDCVVGYSTEIARSYISDRCWFHTNYVGDSVFGQNVSLGSGAVTANLRLDEQSVLMNVKGEKVNTGLNKLGNIIGNNVRIGVNSSLSPGIKIGSKVFIGSNVLVHEDIEEGKYVYAKQELIIKDNTFDITKVNREEIKRNLAK